MYVRTDMGTRTYSRASTATAKLAARKIIRLVPASHRVLCFKRTRALFLRTTSILVRILYIFLLKGMSPSKQKNSEFLPLYPMHIASS